VPRSVHFGASMAKITGRELLIYVITFFLPPLGVFLAQVHPPIQLFWSNHDATFLHAWSVQMMDQKQPSSFEPAVHDVKPCCTFIRIMKAAPTLNACVPQTLLTRL